MARKGEREDLSRLSAESERSVRALLARVGLVSGATPVSTASPGGVTGESGPAAGAVTVSVNLMGGTIFLDDERRVRALAKEIKRLITEDKRRGLAV